MMEVDKPPDSDNKGDRPSAPTRQRLPSTVLGNVFNHLPYTDVRKALRVGKEISTRAAQNIQTLNIMKPCEMDIVAVRRFTNVEQVNILCLFDCEYEDFNETDSPMTLSLQPEVIGRVVPFLLSIPKLKHVSCGGFVYGRREGRGFREYRPEGSTSEESEGVLDLLRAFAGAFYTRALNPNLVVVGLGSFFWMLDEDDDYMTSIREKARQVCKEVCETFPLGYVLRLFVSSDFHDLSHELDPMLDVRRRRNSNITVREWLSEARTFASLLLDGMERRGVSNAANERERRDLEDLCTKTQKSETIFYDDWYFMKPAELDTLENFIESGFKTSEALAHDDIFHIIFEVEKDEDDLERRSHNYAYLLTSTFKALTSMGVPIRRDPRLVLLDDFKYPLLRGSQAGTRPSSSMMEED